MHWFRPHKCLLLTYACQEEYHTAEEGHHQKLELYQKEIKRSRKEAFKSSSAMVKLQEELKSCRSSLNAMSTNMDSEKARAARREQEAFTAQYQLISVQEALEKAQERIKTGEEERDALKTSLKEEEVARIAAEGCIALPVSSRDEDDECASPIKSPSVSRQGEPAAAGSQGGGSTSTTRTIGVGTSRSIASREHGGFFEDGVSVWGLLLSRCGELWPLICSQ